MTNSIEKLRELLHNTTNAMLVTHRLDGSLHGRPMLIVKGSPDDELWFLTRLDTEKVDEVMKDENVAITTQQGGAFVAVAGTARVETDRKKIESVWDPAFDMWFEGGKQDPRAAIIVVAPQHAEYWDYRGVNALSFVFDAVKGVVTGDEQPTFTQRTHGQVDLH